MATTENSFSSKFNVADLSTIILKGSPNPSERDAGFCSGSSEVGDDAYSIDNPSSSHSHNSNNTHLNERLHDHHNHHHSHHHNHHHLDDPNSPTDSSEDSIEVKVTPVSFTRNKRKSTEPSRVICDREETGPLKKRIRYHAEVQQRRQLEDIENLKKSNDNSQQHLDDDNSHFRPWGVGGVGVGDESSQQHLLLHDQLMPNPAEILIRHPGVTTLHRNLKPCKISSNDIQEEPLALIAKKSTTSSSTITSATTTTTSTTTATSTPTKSLNLSSIKSIKQKSTIEQQSQQQSSSTKSQNSKIQQQTLKISKQKQNKLDLNNLSTSAEVPNQRQRSNNGKNNNNNKNNKNKNNELLINDNNNVSDILNNNFKIELDDNENLSTEFNESKLSDDTNNNSLDGSEQNQQQRIPQRNYKNMTRERRIEANARERTRVHTISAAYDTLRKSVPAYSNSQKLSKLSVLRVACSYILTLSRMAGYDYSEDQSEPSLASCVDMVTKTIQTEGKIRKKKDE